MWDYCITRQGPGQQDGKMTIKAIKFTPEVMLSAPRRSAAVPSPDGTKALFTVSSSLSCWGWGALCGLKHGKLAYPSPTLGVDVFV